MPRKIFIAVEILTAADVNTNLMDQAVMVFDDSAARGSAIPSPVEGMVTYRKDDKLVEVNNGTSYVPIGTILQVVSTAKTDTFTTSSTTFTTVTGLTASITPSSTSSKVLIFAQISFSLANAAPYGHFRFSGGNSGTFVGDAASNRISGVFGGFNAGDQRSALLLASLVYLDSPNTTSSVTYGVETRIGASGSVFINRSNFDGDNASHSRGASSITVMEVAG